MTLQPPSTIAAQCRPLSWQRLRPRLAALAAPADAGPELLVQWLLATQQQLPPGSTRTEARRLLQAMARQPWHVSALEGPYGQSPRLGFRVHAAGGIWWLQFGPVPTPRICQIERVSA